MTDVGERTAESADETPDATEDDEEVDTSHLDGIDDGCGCAEVWEHLSEQRSSDS
jgi:hypothetical protein